MVTRPFNLMLTHFAREDRAHRGIRQTAAEQSKASPRAIDALFMQVRRRLSLLERPIGTASNNRRIWHGYSAYNQRSIVKLLEMSRVFYNYVLVGAEKQTPAMRLGLAKGRVSIDDIVYFQP